jgi:hypothetical protein
VPFFSEPKPDFEKWMALDDNLVAMILSAGEEKIA